MEFKTKYFQVNAKCGHVGRNNCVVISFAVAAESGKDAARKARGYRRVKHHRPDAIVSVSEITFEEYMILKAENDADPYLHCKNIQEQRQIENFEERIESCFLKQPPRRARNAEYRRRLDAIRRQEDREILDSYWWEEDECACY